MQNQYKKASLLANIFNRVINLEHYAEGLLTEDKQLLSKIKRNTNSIKKILLENSITN